ncbi:MAG: hypothetical protein RR365_06200 [Bacteroides sp.]
MLRDLIVNEGLAAEATYKASVAMNTGMAVVENDTAGTADFVAAETGDNLYFVQKARIPVGRDAAGTEFSDWEAAFNTVVKDELLVLYKYPAGSVFGTDAYATNLTNADKGKVVSAGIDGKLGKATAGTVKSVYKFQGLYTDNGHILAKVKVLDAAVAN